MSHRPSERGTARWSVPGQPALTPALIAWLPASSSRVKVGPPLSPRGSRLATALFKAKPQVAPVSRLPPLLVIATAPPQFVAALLARMAFFRAAGSSWRRPEALAAELSAMVTLVSVRLGAPRPECRIPPPGPLVMLSLTVTFVNEAVYLLSMPPPPLPPL